ETGCLLAFADSRHPVSFYPIDSHLPASGPRTVKARPYSAPLTAHCPTKRRITHSCTQGWPGPSASDPRHMRADRPMTYDSCTCNVHTRRPNRLSFRHSTEAIT